VNRAIWIQMTKSQSEQGYLDSDNEEPESEQESY